MNASRFARPLFVTVAFVSIAACAPGARAQDSSINLRHTTTVSVVEKTKDAVVYISSRKIVAQRISPFGDDPFFRQFDMPGTQVRAVPVGSLGSGFIVHPDGYIVTNNHVIDRAREITVQLHDGDTKYQAELISADPDADLAILKINANKPLPAIELGDSSDLMIGEPVIAVGNPLGFSHSVSTGIVSAIHRDLKAGGDKTLGDLIQTDAAINPGNSGGPLLNAYGQVIGINTAIRSDAQNIGFAIQVNRLRDLIPELMSPSAVSKLDIPLKLKEKRTIKEPATVLTSLERDADGATVESIAGEKPRDIIDAYAILLKQKAGTPFEVGLKGTAPISITPKTTPMPDALVRAKQRLGISVEPLTPMLAQRLGLGVEDGMLVKEVLKGSAAAQVGMEPGDVVLQLGRWRISTLSDFSVLLEHMPETGGVTVGFLRGDAVAFRTMRL